MKKIQNIFLYHATVVALKGILWGTMLGIGFCLLQKYSHVISLDESAYYMQYVPIKLIGWHVLFIDFFTIIFCLIMMLIPLLIVRRISIIRAIRFK